MFLESSDPRLKALHVELCKKHLKHVLLTTPRATQPPKWKVHFGQFCVFTIFHSFQITWFWGLKGGWVTLVWMRFVLDAYLVLGSRPLCALTESRQLYTGETWTSSACRMNQRISFFLRLSSLFSFPPSLCVHPASSLIQRRWVFSGVDSRANPRPIDFRESQHCYSRQITYNLLSLLFGR